MIQSSAIYSGKVRHRRFDPVEREFDFKVEMFYLDLDEIEAVLATHPLYSTRLRGPAGFRRTDFLGRPYLPLHESVRELVADQIGWKPDGPIRLLTNLRQWGVLANPVSFYYCFDDTTGKLRVVLAEVTNTPWGDRECYVLEAGESSRVLRGSFDKKMHVSPLMGMDQVHEIRVAAPGKTLSVHVANHEAGEVVFEATLRLDRKSLNRKSMGRMLWAGLPMPQKVLAGIYTQAARARLAGVPWHRKPETGDLPCAGPEGMICPMKSDRDSSSARGLSEVGRS